jgi:hypothetical protein
VAGKFFLSRGAVRIPLVATTRFMLISLSAIFFVPVVVSWTPPLLEREDIAFRVGSRISDPRLLESAAAFPLSRG